MEKLTRIGGDLNEIAKFMEFNATAVRKIMKKFDKKFKG